MDNIINEIWQYAEKKNKHLYNWMNKDTLNGFIVDKNVFWFETICHATMPNYIYNILKNYGKRKKLTCLYDIK